MCLIIETGEFKNAKKIMLFFLQTKVFLTVSDRLYFSLKDACFDLNSDFFDRCQSCLKDLLLDQKKGENDIM